MLGNKKILPFVSGDYITWTIYPLKLIEWIELVSLMGANKMFLYDLHMDTDMAKVVDYYVKKGIVDLTKTSSPKKPLKIQTLN